MGNHLPPPKNKHVKPTKDRVAETADKVERMIRRKKLPNSEFSLRTVLPVLGALALYVLARLLKAEGMAGIASYLLPVLFAGVPVLLRAAWNALQRRFTEGDLLILIAVAGAFCLREYSAGAAAMLAYRFAELLEAFMAAHGSAALDKLKDRLPEKASVETEEGVEVVPTETVLPGDVLVVLPGEMLAADGEILEGVSSVDASFLTGESAPRDVAEGALLLSGCVNLSNMLRIKVLRPAEESAAARLVEIVELAHTNRSGRERFMSRFTNVFTPLAACVGVLVGMIPPLFDGQWLEWLHRAVLTLLIASPCGLIVSVPLTYFGSVVSAARQGIYVKGAKFMETLSKTQTMLFEKTGVITERNFTITEVFPTRGTEQELLNAANMAEASSEHPIAKALRGVCGKSEAELIQVEESPCRGISAFAGGRHICVGNAGMMMDHQISYAVPSRKGIDIHVAVDNEYLGYFLLSNKTREGAFDTIESIRQRGVKSMVMLTGDLRSSAKQIASSLSFDMVKTELNRDGKLAALEYLLAARGDRAALAFVGNGADDEELFARADAGIVLGAIEAEKAIDQADIVIMGENIESLAELMRLAKGADLSARLNIIVSLAVRLGCLALGLLGLLPMMPAILLQTAAAAACAIMALRAFIPLGNGVREKKK